MSTEIICKYKINKSDDGTRIMGDTFIENNKNNIKIIYEGKEQELIGIFNTKEIEKDILEITIKQIDKITHASYMFYNCTSLISIDNIDNWDTTKINDMNNLFYNCRSLLPFPNISKWNTSNVVDMSYLFYNCSSLLELPDISNWNTTNVNNLSYIFAYCKSLVILPDI